MLRSSTSTASRLQLPIIARTPDAAPASDQQPSRRHVMVGAKPHGQLQYRNVNGKRMAYVDEGGCRRR